MHNYEEFTVIQLKKMCKERRLVCHNLKKNKIIEALKEDDARPKNLLNIEPVNKHLLQDRNSKNHKEKNTLANRILAARKERFFTNPSTDDQEAAKVLERKKRFGDEAEFEKIELRKKRFENK